MAYRQFQVVGPFGGVVDNLPAPNKPPNAFDDVLNMFCRKGRLQGRPQFNTFGNPPDGAILRNAMSYEDVLGNIHSLALTTQHAYAITAGPTYNALTLPYADLSGTSLPFGYAIINNRVYFANGSRKVSFADGSNSIQVAGDVQGSCRYMGVLANHLLTAFTTEPPPDTGGSIEYPYRIRWSASGNTDDWTSFGSGFADLLDVPDRITNLFITGRNGYIFRKNGLSVVFPTGEGEGPFAVEPYSNAPEGIGCVYPYSLGSYGTRCAFVANDDIYSFNGVEFQAIGMNAKKKIFADLALASGDQVCGWMRGAIGPGYDLLSYWLSIPGVDVTWVYLFDENAWQRVTGSNGRITFVGSIATS